MTSLYSGALSPEQVELAWVNSKASSASSTRPPSEIVWDAERPDVKPPWGDKISPVDRTLADYFVTAGLENLIAVLRAAVTETARANETLRIR